MSRILRFGPQQLLAGILTGEESATGPVLILPSAGLQPRAGPFRLHVDLARRLEAQGLPTFRFDVPGVGEAPRITGFDSVAAVCAAMDLLEASFGYRCFAVGGICSAADLGWNAAVKDTRVVAVLLLDGIAFRGPWFRVAKAVDRLQRVPSEWRRMARDAMRRRGGAKNAPQSADFRDWPSHGNARAQFAALVARGTQMLWIFTGGYTDRFLHPRQFRWAFGTPAEARCVRMHYWPDCDHTFYARAHRDRLVERIAAWLSDLDRRTVPS